MTSSLLIMLREGFEAALIVAIVLAYVRRTGHRELERSVWVGVASATVLAAAIGVGIHLSIGELEGTARLHAFALISLLAAAVLTWMIFWMRKQSRLIRNELHDKIDTALTAGNAKLAVAGVAFIAVLREGIEAALFLVAAATDDSGSGVVVGALVGLALASALGYLVFLGGRKLPMKAFFTITGVILILFAAGLVSKGIMFMQSAEDFGSLNMNGVYDLRSQAWLTPDTESGKLLTALLGWDPRPSFEQVFAWFAYLVPVLYFFLRPERPAAEPTTRPTERSART